MPTIKRGLRRRAITFWSAVSVVLLFAAAVPSSASADTSRTFNLALTCGYQGLPYGLSVNNGSGWYYPSGSSYASGNVKYFSVYIPASATMIEVNTSCDGISTSPQSYFTSITAGTSTINATGNCYAYNYYGYWYNNCTITSLSYS